jgi:PHD/YefM family antitoxin component YafN of YafNO toxin-antitoxin module
MTRVTASDFARNFSRFRVAAQRGPVAVTSHDQVTGYFISAQDYEAFQALKARATQALGVEELEPHVLEALGEARMDDRHAHLDALMD